MNEKTQMEKKPFEMLKKVVENGLEAVFVEIAEENQELMLEAVEDDNRFNYSVYSLLNEMAVTGVKSEEDLHRFIARKKETFKTVRGLKGN